MAARNRKGLSEATRTRIQTTMIVKRLEKHILGEVEMSSAQVSAALGLIKKTLPDLAAVHSTQGEEKSFEDWLDELEDEAETPKAQD